MLLEVVRAASRHLLRNPGITLLSVALLGASLTAVATAFALVSAVTLAQSPYPTVDRLWVPALAIAPADGSPPRPARFAYPDVDALRQQPSVFDAIGVHVSLELPLVGAPGPERVRAEFVNPEYFPALGARPAAGSLPPLAAGGGQEIAARGEALLSHALWTRRFGADPSVLGREIEILGTSFQVLGVLSPDFEGLGGDVDLWLDVGSLPAIADFPDLLTGTDYARFQVVARALPGVSETQVAHAVGQAGRAIEARRPEVTWGPASVERLAEERSDPALRRALAGLLAAAGLVLLIACLNVAGLHLSRAAARAQDFAVRKAIGAAPGRILAQVFAESGLLALAGGLVGLVGTNALILSVTRALETDGVLSSTGPDASRLVGAGISPGVVVFGVAAAFVTAIVAGAVPALDVIRGDVVRHLREGSGSVIGGSGRRQSLGRRALLVVQAAVSVVLLTLSGLFLLDLTELLSLDPGFDGRSVETLRITSATLYGPEEAPRFHRRLIEDVGQLPGVASVALGSCIPLECGWSTPVLTAEATEVDPSAPPAGAHFVSPGYFETLGIAVVAGRGFTNADTRDSRRVAVVSRALAERLFPGQGAVGRQVKFDPQDEPAEVVGVIADVRQRSLLEASEDVYIPDYQNGAAWGVLFVEPRTAGGVDAAALRSVLKRVDAGLPYEPSGTLGEHLSRVSAQNRHTTRLLSGVALLAVLLTLVGVYGVAALAVTYRRRELALRLTVGASGGELLRRILAHGLRPVLIGILLAAPLAWSASRRFELSFTDGYTPLVAVYLLAAAVVAGAALLASLPPARRTLTIDPAVALRAQR